MSFFSNFASSLSFLSWKNEYLVIDNCIDNFPETSEEILLQLRECFDKYGLIKCAAYEKNKRAKLSILIAKSGNKITQKTHMDFEINSEKLEENFNQIATYILDKKKTINYLREYRSLKEINEDILKINNIRDNQESWISLPDELKIFKGLGREKIERRLKTILMMKIEGYYHTVIDCFEVLPWTSIEKYSVAFNYNQLLKVNSDSYEDVVYENIYNYETLKKSINEIVKYIEDELNKGKE